MLFRPCFARQGELLRGTDYVIAPTIIDTEITGKCVVLCRCALDRFQCFADIRWQTSRPPKDAHANAVLFEMLDIVADALYLFEKMGELFFVALGDIFCAEHVCRDCVDTRINCRGQERFEVLVAAMVPDRCWQSFRACPAAISVKYESNVHFVYSSSMKIMRAKVAGFCFGVERAYELVQKARASQQPHIQIVGELIHNPQVVAELAEVGVRTVGSADELTPGTAIVRAHGTSDLQRAAIQKKAGDMIDASCPFVTRLHAAAGKFIKEGLPVVIVGRADHPEMVGVVQDFPAVIVTIDTASSEIANLANKKVGLLVQTTETTASLAAMRDRLTELSCEIAEINTICSATTDRQAAVRELAPQVDAMIVIGGKNSNNTKNLHELASQDCPSYWIETEDELQKDWFAGVEIVGVTAGASTPESRIEAVIERLNQMQ